MADYMTLLGAEQVGRAGHEISAAAGRIEAAARSFDGTVDRLQRLLDDHADRVRTALEEHAARFERTPHRLARWLEGRRADVGQHDAAAALGLGRWQAMRWIILPQALRAVIPSMMNSAVSVFKDTSLVTVVSLYELTGALSLALGFAAMDGVCFKPTLDEFIAQALDTTLCFVKDDDFFDRLVS